MERKFFYISDAKYNDVIYHGEDFPVKTYPTREEAENALEKQRAWQLEENTRFPDEQDDPNIWQIFSGVSIDYLGGQ